MKLERDDQYEVEPRRHDRDEVEPRSHDRDEDESRRHDRIMRSLKKEEVKEEQNVTPFEAIGQIKSLAQIEERHQITSEGGVPTPIEKWRKQQNVF